jgi:hypothetical protein
MKVVSSYIHTLWYQGEEPADYHEKDYIYRLLLCADCNSINLTVDNEDWPVQDRLYPSDDPSPVGLPPTIAPAYEAARTVRRIDSNAYGVLLGRVLELVCLDRGAKGRSLSDQLKALAASGEIPGRLADMANQLRDLRNIGAHATLGELTQAEVPILDNLCQAVLEYVYTAPKLIERVEQRIEALKKRTSPNRTT